MNQSTRPSPHIVVVGGGQSARWLLFALAEQLARGAPALRGGRVTVIEGRTEFGTGLAWSGHYALEDHLASRATPLSRRTYGDQQQRQFQSTVELLQELGVSVTLLPGQEAVSFSQDGARQEVQLASGRTLGADFVVLATGYGRPPWPARALRDPVFAGRAGIHHSPWPAQTLQEAVFEGSTPLSETCPKRVLILGSYLTAIDTALSLALRAGAFRPGADGRLQFEAPAGFALVIGSRSGQLPKVWGQEPPAPHQPRWFNEEKLSAAIESSERGRFLPIDTALQLLGAEVAEALAEEPSATRSGRRLRALTRRRIRAWQRRLAGSDTAETLRQDIASVMASGQPFGSYAETRYCRWQAVIISAIRLWSEFSPAFCAEDQIFFDRELRTTFYNHMLPMTLNSAIQIEAMMRSGHLSVVALGRDYQLQPTSDRDARLLLSFTDARGRPQAAAFSDVVDATGLCSDIERHPSPLIQSMLESGNIQPALRAFRGDASAVAVAAADTRRPIITLGHKSYLVGGGIFVNPKTCEVIPRGTQDESYRGPDHAGVYAMGPNLIGQFVDAQSLGQAQRDARRIASDICRKQTPAVEPAAAAASRLTT